MLGNKKVIALGFFDGVHLGHGTLLKKCGSVADELGVSAVVMTFDTHPHTLITGAPMLLLNTEEDRKYFIQNLYGLDDVISHPFDETMMHMHWRDFVQTYLVGELEAVHLVCGHDYHFGYKGQGDAQKLRQICLELGIGCHVLEKVELDDITISSTHIRSLITQGKMGQANRFLGHCHTLTGEVVRGQQLGRTIGIPTANLAMPKGLLSPMHGVYAVRVHCGKDSFIGVCNVGVRPTVAQSDVVSVETWVLDFTGDLYGKKITIEFCDFLRGEKKFAGLSQLKEAISQDAQTTRRFFQP